MQLYFCTVMVQPNVQYDYKHLCDDNFIGNNEIVFIVNLLDLEQNYRPFAPKGPSHYLNQWWHRFCKHTTRPSWVNVVGFSLPLLCNGLFLGVCCKQYHIIFSTTNGPPDFISHWLFHERLQPFITWWCCLTLKSRWHQKGTSGNLCCI